MTTELKINLDLEEQKLLAKMTKIIEQTITTRTQTLAYYYDLEDLKLVYSTLEKLCIAFNISMIETFTEMPNLYKAIRLIRSISSALGACAASKIRNISCSELDNTEEILSRYCMYSI